MNLTGGSRVPTCREMSHPDALELRGDSPRSRGRSHDRNEFYDIPWRADQSSDGNTGIQCRELATMADRQPGKIQVGDLLVTAQPGHVEQSRIGQRKDILPKHVPGLSAEDSKSFGDFARGCRHGRIGGTAEHPDAAILGDWARGPRRFADGREPAMSRFVVRMSCVEQCDQDVNVEQLGHSVSSRS